MILMHLSSATVESSNTWDSSIVWDDAAGVFDDAAGVFDDAFGLYIFDMLLSTYTEFPDLIEVEISFNSCDRIALFGLIATDIDFELTDNDTSTVVDTRNVDLSLGSGEYQEAIIQIFDIYSNATLKITINNSGSYARCGLGVIGVSTNIGTTVNQVISSFVDYSIKNTNSFGYTYLSQGSWAKAPEVKTIIDYSDIDRVYEELADARGELVVLDVNESATDYETLYLCGLISDWRIRITNNTKAYVEMTIRGAI